MAVKKKKKISSLRVLTEIAIIGFFVVGLFLQTGTGSLSATGIWEVFALCPIGAFTAFVASKTFIPPQIVGIIIFVLLILVLGRAFCAWACPVQLWYKVFNRTDVGSKKPKEQALALEEQRASLREEGETKQRFFGVPKLSMRGGLHDSRNWVLVATLGAAFIVGFPIFCLVCPIGLTFATLVSLWNFINLNTFGPGVIIFPLILLIELLVLRKWCHTLCPLAAMISWISRGNKTFLPNHNENACLTTSNKSVCNECATACPEEIDLREPQKGAPLHQCTKCHLCAEACPVSAITFPFLPSKKRGDQEANLDTEKEQIF